MDHLFYLSEVYGPRVTNSPNHRAPAGWIVKRLESYELQNVILNRKALSVMYGSTRYFTTHLLSRTMLRSSASAGMDSVDSRPDYRDVIYSPLHGPEDFAKYKGKLQGKIVLMADMRVLEMHTEPRRIA
jgi:carboxypeptidase Q